MATINKINVGGTEYDLIASSADSVAWDNVNGRPVVFPTPYGVCSTAATNVAKEVTVNGDFILETGARVLVNFAQGVSIPAGEQMTLNVTPKDGEATGAKNVYLDDDTLGSPTELNRHFRPGWLGRVYEFVYDGSNWKLLSRSERDTDTTYTNASLGQGYTTCSTTADTVAKTATLSDYKLTTGGIVSVKFTYGNTASRPTLNIRGQGAKLIYYKGAALTDTNLIKAGDIVTMIYSNYYHIISIDKIPIDKEEYGKYISPSGIVLGTNLTSNTVNTYGGGNSIVAGNGNTVSQNISLNYLFGENNNATDTSDEGTSEGVSKYNFFAGYGNKISETYPRSMGSVAIGLNNTVASNKTTSPNTMAKGSTSYAYGSVALGTGNTVGSGSFAGYAVGSNNTVSGAGSIAMGYSNTIASGKYSTAIGYSHSVTGENNFVGGYGNTVYGSNNAVIGSGNSLGYSTSYEAHYCTLLGRGHLIGNRTTSGIARPAYLTVVGRYSKPSRTGQTATSDTVPSPSNNAGTDGPYLFVIGNGTSTSAQSTAMRVSVQGNVAITGALYENGAADYAECFEWSDGNKDNEDRRGRFVTFDYNETIRYATEKDDYILGIVSATPCIVGDSYHEDWQGRYKKNIYGQILYENYEIPAEYDEEGREIVPAIIVPKPIDNEDFDPEKEYIPRLNRSEWTIIGMLGKLIVDDDGTCEVGGFATPGKDGIATRGTAINGYKVIARLDENHIRVIFR